MPGTMKKRLLAVVVTGILAASGAAPRALEALRQFREWGGLTPCGEPFAKTMDRGQSWWMVALFVLAHVWVAWGIVVTLPRPTLVVKALITAVALELLVVYFVEGWILFWCTR